MKDREIYEQLGGRMDEHQSSAECPVTSVQDKSLVDENGECEQWDREVSFKTEHGEGKVNSFYSGEPDEYVNSLIASAVIGLASSLKNKQKR